MPALADRSSCSAASRRQPRSRSCSGRTPTPRPRARLTALMTTMAATYVADADPGQSRRAVADPDADGRHAPRATSTSSSTRRASSRSPAPMLDPVEVANAAIYFLSDESRAVTGQSLAVDGGWSLVSTTAEPARDTPDRCPDLPLLADVDVCVVGAGSAGSTAAIAAARTGARTLLVDRLPFLGGTSTAVLDTFYGFFTPGASARKVVGGIGDDVVAALRRLGPGRGAARTRTVPGPASPTSPSTSRSPGRTWSSRPGLASCSTRRSRTSRSAMAGSTSIVVATRAGLARVRARVFVDASGDADLCAFAGFGYETAGGDRPGPDADDDVPAGQRRPRRGERRSRRTSSTR